MRRSHSLVRGLLGAALYPLVAGIALAQARPGRTAVAAAPIDAGMLKGLNWRSIGPATMSGRVTDFAVARSPGLPDVLYVGAASGGLWKTTDWGTTWDPVFDSVDGMISIGDVAVAPSSPNVVWVGTGEANNRQSSSWGDGIYKSVDAGRVWKHIGLKETRHIGRIVIHPTNPDVVYVAALGHLWGSNPERGVFRTTDGGTTWEKVLYVDEHTGAVDLVMDPLDPQTLIAATYQRQRKAWGFNGGGPGSGIWRTKDGGKTWTRLTQGLPNGDKGRIGLDIYRNDGRIVYAVVESDPQRGPLAGARVTQGRTGGIFRSADGGDTWEQVNPINVRPMYFSLIRIDPKDPQRIYYGGSSIMTSHDGGRTFYDPGYGGQGVHPDQHALWIDPDDPNRLVLGGDGGVFLSYNRGQTWRFVDNLPIGQFYHVDVDMRDPYHVCGGLQDNGDWCVPSATRDIKGISRRDAYLVGGGDGYWVQIDKTDPNIFYVEQGGANVARFNFATGETQAIRPGPKEKPGLNEEGEPVATLRGNWSSPVQLSSFDQKTVYVGMNVVFRSPDRGVTWTAISPDLTAAVDRDTLQMMGARVAKNALSRHDGVSSYSTLTTLSESRLDRNVLYTGSDDGQVHVTRDGGASWKNISDRFAPLARYTYVSAVLASRHVAGRAYATFDGHFNDDYRPYVYVSNDYGQTWRSITRGLPETSVNAIAEHPRNPNLLFLGHEKGMHVSIDGGENWVSLNTNFPNVPVDAVLVHPRDNDLIAATHGRGFWILDDVGPLEALASPSVATGDQVLPSRPGRIFNFHHYSGWFWPGHYVAPNPEYGTAVSYWLTEPAKDVQLRVLDASGAVVRTLSAPGQRGANRIYWDLRSEPAQRPDPKELYNPVFRPPPEGPPVLPGTYTAVITVAGRGELRVPLRVEGDPLNVISDADRQTRQTALQDLYAMQKSGVAARDALTSLTEQLAVLKKRLEGAEDGRSAAPAELRNRLTTLTDNVAALQRQVDRDLSAVNRLTDAIRGYTALPTQDQMRQLAWAHEDLSASLAKLNGVFQKDVPDLYSALQARNLWPSPTQTIVLPPRRSTPPR